MLWQHLPQCIRASLMEQGNAAYTTNLHNKSSDLQCFQCVVLPTVLRSTSVSNTAHTNIHHLFHSPQLWPVVHASLHDLRFDYRIVQARLSDRHISGFLRLHSDLHISVSVGAETPADITVRVCDMTSTRYVVKWASSHGLAEFRTWAYRVGWSYRDGMITLHRYTWYDDYNSQRCARISSFMVSPMSVRNEIWCVYAMVNQCHAFSVQYTIP